MQNVETGRKENKRYFANSYYRAGVSDQLPFELPVHAANAETRKLSN